MKHVKKLKKAKLKNNPQATKILGTAKKDSFEAGNCPLICVEKN